MLGDGPETRRAPSISCWACVVRAWGAVGLTMVTNGRTQKQAPFHVIVELFFNESTAPRGDARGRWKVAHVDPLECKNTRPRSRSWSPPSFTPNGRPSSGSPRAPTCATPTGAASCSGEVVLRLRLSRFTIVIAPGGAAVASEALYQNRFSKRMRYPVGSLGGKGGAIAGNKPPQGALGRTDASCNWPKVSSWLRCVCNTNQQKLRCS